MRRSALLIVLLLASPVATAQGKGPDTARICGATDGVTVTGPERVNALALQSGFSIRSAPLAARFYTVDLTTSRADDEVHWSLLYVPSDHAVRVNRADFTAGLYPETGSKPYWVTPASASVSAFDEATRQLEPFAKSSAEWQAPPVDGGRFWTIALLGAAVAAAVLAAAIAWRARRRAAGMPSTQASA